jgi:hypothetical protein
MTLHEYLTVGEFLLLTFIVWMMISEMLDGRGR